MERKQVGQQGFKVGRIYSDLEIQCNEQTLLRFIEVNDLNHSCFEHVGGPKKYVGDPISFLSDVTFFEVEQNQFPTVEDIQYSPAELVKQQIPERRLFAAMAMQITVGNVKTRHSDTQGVYLSEQDLKQAAKDAVRISDMLIEELNKEETK